MPKRHNKAIKTYEISSYKSIGLVKTVGTSFENKILNDQVIKLCSRSTQLNMKLIMLINVKMPTIVGIFTFISMINTTSETLKAINIHILAH